MDRYRLLTSVITLAAALALATVPEAGRSGLRVLQMNLCNSGWASCYTGKSVRAAADAIRLDRPDVVTLNEVCRGDLTTLVRAFGPDQVSEAFAPAIDRDTGRPILCRDGEPYGIGILARSGTAVRDGLYPTQAPGAVEGRAWLCATGGVVVCTTHLANANPLVALAQCRYLFTTVVAASPGPVVIGGDFNLGNLSTCMPDGYTAGSDGGFQFVAARAAGVGSVTLVGLHDTTDHPGLLVLLTRGSGRHG